MNTTGNQQQFSARHYVYALARHANGKIVLGGDYDTFNSGPAESLLQLNADGTRDPSFESNGPGVHAEVNVLLRQPDGKLLVGFYPKITILSQATKLNSARRGGIGRLLADGTTDTTFTSPFDAESFVNRLALQADGKVIVGGSFRLIGSPRPELYFARLNVDGTLDGGFHPPNGGAVQLGTIQPDQKILVLTAPFGGLELIRLNPDGSPDATFSVALPNGSVEHVVMQPDGKIILTGFVYLPDGTPARLARLNPDGSFDATFVPGTGPDAGVGALLLQPDGQILIGGKFLAYDGTARNKIARVNANGSLDTAFLPVNLNPSAPGADTGRYIGAFALQADGKILVGTNSGGNNHHPPPNRVFRLNPDGSLDSSFPLGTGVEGLSVSVNTMVVQPDESVVIGGEFEVVNGVARLALARLLGPPRAPTLDDFFFYKVKSAKGAPKFAPVGPITLADMVVTNDVNVQTLTALGLPADPDAGGVADAATLLTDYALKARKGGTKFTPIADVRVESACGDFVVTLKKPEHLLVPTRLDPTHLVPAPDPAAHQVDHFRCYVVKLQKTRSDGTPVARFPKGAQVDVSDQFQSRRYDLKKLTRVCYPVAESGSPVVLKTGAPFAFTPAALRHATAYLACYQAKPAKKTILQNGCGPLDASDKGTKIVPPPPKHQKRTGLYVNGALGPGVVDTAKEFELCTRATVSRP
jgi:uncharacterized delta-60 repeat protein